MAEKTRAELFDEFRAKVLEDIKSGTQDFDKNLLTFSSGALGLSLAFIKDIAPLGRIILIPCLFASWIAFALCLMVTMAGFHLSIRALLQSLPYAKAYYLDNKEDAFDKHLKTLCCRLVDWCTCAGSALFVAGVVFTIVFVSVNLNREAKHMKKEEARKMVMGDWGEAIKPPAMTPITDGENRGIKPTPMTQTPPQAPGSGNAPPPTQSPQK
jgi:hypothetical protein